MKDLKRLLSLTQICIIILSTILFVNAASPEYNDESDIMKAYEKTIYHLSFMKVAREIDEKFEYLSDLIKSGKGDHLVVFPTTEWFTKDQHLTEASTKSVSPTTPAYTKGKPLTEASTKSVSQTTPVYAQDKHSTEASTKSVSPTTPVYAQDKHTTESSTKTACNTIESSTTDTYAQSSSTTADYSKQSTLRSSENEKCSEDIPTTPFPPSSTSYRPPTLVGSISGVPGEHFPDYTDIPITSFTCSDKDYMPGFYADLETGCQVFHVCWQNRRESFLCPLGTTFNQALLACDYWYSTNCSLAPLYYNVNAESSQNVQSLESQSSMIDVLLQKSYSSTDASVKSDITPDAVLSAISKFLPVKAKVVVYPETDDKRAKIVASTSVGNDGNTNQKEDEPKPLKLQVPEQKREKVVISISPRGKVAVKDVPKTSEQKTQTLKSDALKTEILKKDAANAFKAMLWDKLTEKLRFARAEKANRFVTVSSHSADKMPSGEKVDFQGFELALERLCSKIAEGLTRLLEKAGKSYPEKEPASVIKPVPVTTQPEPSSTVKPAPVKMAESASTRKPRVLTQLNPRFIVKPIFLPKQGTNVPVTTSGRDNSTKRAVHVKYSKISTHHTGKNISPETKRVLAENYARFMRVRKLS